MKISHTRIVINIFITFFIFSHFIFSAAITMGNMDEAQVEAAVEIGEDIDVDLSARKRRRATVRTEVLLLSFVLTLNSFYQFFFVNFLHSIFCNQMFFVVKSKKHLFFLFLLISLSSHFISAINSLHNFFFSFSSSLLFPSLPLHTFFSLHHFL